jgi:hypothetical protein
MNYRNECYALRDRWRHMLYSSLLLSLPVILETSAAASGVCVKSWRVVFFFLYLENKLLPQRKTNE